VYDAVAGKSPDIAHEALPDHIQGLSPDFVLMIGQCENAGGMAISDQILTNICLNRKTMHLCCDGSEPAWWPQVERYKTIFSLQVNIDGVSAGPFADSGITTLCPIDASKYENVPLVKDRGISLGFRGGYGQRGSDARANIICDIMDAGLITSELRHGTDYNEYRDFLLRCKCTWNHAGNGGGGTQFHVKARVVESMMAGSILVETEGSPASQYFDPGVDYLTYNTIDQVRQAIGWVSSNTDPAQQMADQARSRAQKYSAAMFWERIFKEVSL
jgi:hypothetical protein